MTNALKGLEKELEHYAFILINLDQTGGFRDCTMPNEFHPEQAVEHLKNIAKGVIVSCGSERSFFTAIHCPKDKCEALLVCDVNAKIKAYIDFNVILLKLAANRNEYADWVQNPSLPALRAIYLKLQQSDLPQSAKLYYSNRFTAYGAIFYSAASEWRTNKYAHFFDKCRYDLDDDQFNTLQTLAREGNIVATLRSITDLSLLKHRTISVVNTSNICNYTLIDLQGLGDSKPRVICTSYRRDDKGEFDHTYFHSHLYAPMSAEQREEFERLIGQLKLCYRNERVSTVINKVLFQPIEQRDLLDDHRWAIYSPKTLSLLKDYVEKYLLAVPYSNPIDLNVPEQFLKINQSVKRVLQNPDLWKYLDRIVANWQLLEQETFEALYDLPDWNNAVKAYLTLHPDERAPFLTKFNLRNCDIF